MGINYSKTNDNDVKIAQISAKNTLDKTQLECETKQKIEISNNQTKFKIEKLRVEEKLSMFHAEKQAGAIDKILEHGYDPEDVCITLGMMYLTQNKNQSGEESNRMDNILKHMQERKENSSGGNRGNQGSRTPPPQYNTGGESEEDLNEDLDSVSRQQQITA